MLKQRGGREVEGVSWRQAMQLRRRAVDTDAVQEEHAHQGGEREREEHERIGNNMKGNRLLP